MKKKLNEFLLGFISILPLLLVIASPETIPDKVPVHWNIDGVIDREGSKYLIPSYSFSIYLILLLCNWWVNHSKHTISTHRFLKIRFVISIFLTAVNLLIFYQLVSHKIVVLQGLTFLLLLLFMAIGNYMIHLKPNWFFGIRNPWTLQNPEVWKKTHMIAGRLWFFTGLAGLFITMFLKTSSLGYFLVSVIFLLVVIPILYSYGISKSQIHKHR